MLLYFIYFIVFYRTFTYNREVASVCTDLASLLSYARYIRCTCCFAYMTYDNKREYYYYYYYKVVAFLHLLS